MLSKNPTREEVDHARQTARGRQVTPIPPLSHADAEELRLTATGDRDAFERFVERHQAGVLRYLLGTMADADRAEDALQETFIAAWRGAAGFRGSGPARAWLLAIARNAARRQVRRRAGEPARFVPLEELGVSAGWGAEGGDDAERRLESRELVEQGFRGLDAEDREILILRELEGFSGEEVAAMLGITLAAAKSRLHRARLRFTAQLRRAHAAP